MGETPVGKTFTTPMLCPVGKRFTTLMLSPVDKRFTTLMLSPVGKRFTTLMLSPVGKRFTTPMLSLLFSPCITSPLSPSTPPQERRHEFKGRGRGSMHWKVGEGAGVNTAKTLKFEKVGVHYPTCSYGGSALLLLPPPTLRMTCITIYVLTSV